MWGRAESFLTLYLVRRLSHFLAICSDVNFPSRPRPFRMVLGNNHTEVSGGSRTLVLNGKDGLHTSKLS